ncbi:Transposase [Streptococcus henryi]|uniref:Transposase n=1 Tax=Streptococcus henryi TaxID=439219 RepID=A0A1G6AGB3_9STRE|nr:transposase [Streptococcus henryi]SDB07380.1 Transposase [Streptococcus henryi]
MKNHVTHFFFESTGQYWGPLFNIFSDSDLTLVLANPQHIKNVPGRKKDMKDAKWIAQLGRCGLIATSYTSSSEVNSLVGYIPIDSVKHRLKTKFIIFYNEPTLN